MSPLKKYLGREERHEIPKRKFEKFVQFVAFLGVSVRSNE